MKGFIYHIRFAWHLWRNVPGMSLWTALTYPCDRTEFPDVGPVEFAGAEMSEMYE